MRDPDIDEVLNTIRGPVRPSPRFEEELLLRLEEATGSTDPLDAARPVDDHGPNTPPVYVLHPDPPTASRGRRGGYLAIAAAAAAVVVAVLFVNGDSSTITDPAGTTSTAAPSSTLTTSVPTTAAPTTSVPDGSVPGSASLDIAAIDRACTAHFEAVAVVAAGQVDETRAPLLLEALRPWVDALEPAMAAHDTSTLTAAEAAVVDDYQLVDQLTRRYLDDLEVGDDQGLSFGLDGLATRALGVAEQLAAIGATSCTTTS